jgi:hypothetical protein
MGRQKLLSVDDNTAIITQELQTDIFNGSTPEFFINMNPKDIPPKGHVDRGDFIRREKEKCRLGVNIGGIWIPGGLYYHLNYHKLLVDVGKDEVGKTISVISNPDFRDNDWIIHTEYAQAVKEQKGYCLASARQVGKDLLNSSLLYQEDKTITIGEAKIGDRIYGDDGKLTTIKGVYPQGIKPVYKITMLDGREIFAGEEHNWKVFDTSRKKYLTLTTKEMLSNFTMYRESWKDRKNPYTWRYSIDLCKPVEYKEKELLIDPYMFGIWLGDGSKDCFRITNADKEVVDYLYEYADKIGSSIWKYDNPNRKSKASEYKFTFNKDYKRAKYEKHPLTFALDFYKVRNKKHIPKEYLYASVEQRMELLKGLMDSDGTATAGLSFTNTNYQLIKDVETLVRSLGMSCILSDRIPFCIYKGEKTLGKKAYHLQIFTEKPIFKIQRKLDRQTGSKYNKRIPIKNIEYVFDDYTTCIEVDNESHLFLTDGFTVTHNTSCLVSLCARELFLVKGSNALVVFGGTEDKQSFTTKLQTAIEYGEPFIVVPNIDKDWDKTEIRFGYTKKDNNVELHSKLFVYNSVGGIKTETGAGKTISFFAMDEIGKYKFRAVWEAVEPAFKGKFGYRASPYFSWTGGDTEKAEQAFNFTLNPEAANLLPFKTEGRDTAKVLFAQHRIDCKEPVSFVDFLSENNIKHNSNNKELNSLTIWKSNYKKAEELTKQEIELKKQDKDPTAWVKHISYYPLCLKDILSKASSSNFKKEYISQQREYLKSNLSVTYMETKRDIHTKIPELVLSNKKPITSYPKESWHDGDAPICVYDLPKYKGFGVHVASCDPYRENETSSSDSLGAFHVWRRNHNDLTDAFRDKMVLSYKGRPKTVKEFHEMLLDVLEIYDAKLLYEHSDRALLDFFEGKNKTHLLIDAVPIQREINPKSKSSNTKGLRPTAQNKAVLYASALGLVNEEMEDGMLGYAKILDDVLLQELDAFDPDLNMDSYISFSLLAQARLFYDKFGVAVVTDIKREIFIPPKKQITITSAFGFNPRTIPKQKSAFGF